jgi:hypothetical protein
MTRPAPRALARLRAAAGARTGPLLIVSGLVLLPWLSWLVITLPRHYSAHHYWLSWVGFDVAVLVELPLAGLTWRLTRRP